MSGPDLDARTLTALDWDRVRERLAQGAHTARGARLARQISLATELPVVQARYAEVAELMAMAERRERPPLGDVQDIGFAVDEADRGALLDEGVLMEVGATLAALVRLRAWSDRRDAPALSALASGISIDDFLVGELTRSFDPSGELSGTAWPRLGAIRARVDSLKARLREELETLAFGDTLADALQDRFITEREGRWVLPVKASYRRGVGILHGHSQTGETAYVEPTQTVELQNDVRDAEAALERERRRILGELSQLVGRFSDGIRVALDAAAQVDLAVARFDLGATWRGVVPKVGTDGVVKLDGARHPVLALRGADVVPNDLVLDTPHPCLVLTGLNAGGKTVLLKTIGLAALLVRAGIPVPARPGARVDLFPTILADVGDLQSVEGDVSTFSGHVAVLRTVLDRAAPGVLVLLDEVAVGTDPAQGAALARAVMESLLDQGARVVLTTHYPELKGIDDARVVVGAMDHEAGRPTYRLRLGAPGASHALAIAQAMGVPGPVIERARALLDARARELETQAEALRAERERVERLEAGLARRDEELREREARVAKELARDREAARTAVRAELKQLEERVRGLVAALQADPTVRDANKTLEEIRAATRALVPEAAPVPAPAPLRVGMRVWIESLGQSGELVALDGKSAEVRMRSLSVKVDATDVRPTDTPRPPAPAAAPAPAPLPDAGTSLRTGANTCDLRGKRLDEALVEVELFVDGLAALGAGTGHILHGHGTGALKNGVRGFLPRCRHVRAWRPANADEGGDAYTIVEVGRG